MSLFLPLSLPLSLFLSMFLSHKITGKSNYWLERFKVMKRCKLSKSQAFCNHAQVDEHFEYRSKTKVRKHHPWSKMWIKTTKQKMFWKKQQNLSSFLRKKTWVLATTHFGKSRCAFFCVAQIIDVDFFEKHIAFRNNHCCNFQKLCCEVCRKHSLLQCVTCFLLRRLSPNI